MTKQEYEKIAEGKLLTITKKGKVIDIFHKNKIFELRHHNYGGEEYYYLSMMLQPKLEDINITTESDIKALYDRKKELFNIQLEKILELKKDL